MTVISLVMKRFNFETKAAFARFLNIDRAAIQDWERRLDGHIPPRHWGTILDEAKARDVAITIDELRGK